MQRAEVIEVMTLVQTYWPGWSPPEDADQLDFVIDAWHRLLGDVDQPAAVAAADAIHVSGERFFPAPGPGQLRKRALELIQPKAMPDVDEAWAEVLDKIGRVGRYDTPTWSHGAIAGAVRALGWQYLCNSVDHMADRAHFMRLYGKVADRATFMLTMPPSVLELVADARSVGVGHAGELEA